MSELDYEEPPPFEVDVPRVRPFVRRSLRDWKRGCYPPRRGVFLVWGWLLPIWGFGLLIKFGIYVFGVALILLAYPVWLAAELLTHRWRRKRALLEVWTQYMIDVNDLETP